MDTAASIIDEYIKAWLEKLVAECKGYEHVSLMELVRSTDLHAWLLQLGNVVGPAPYGIPRQYSEFVQQGIGMLLDAFLSKTADQVDESDLRRVQPGAKNWAETVLRQAGELSYLKRLAYLERYKVVKCEIDGKGSIKISLLEKNLEILEKNDEYAVLDDIRLQQSEERGRVEKDIAKWLQLPIGEYTAIDQYGIREIKFNQQLFKIFEKQSQLQINEYAEADLFPDEVLIGERTFGDWKKIAAALTAQSQLHFFYTARAWRDLPEPQQNLWNLRHILPAIYTNDELSKRFSHVLELSGIENKGDIVAAFILTAADARTYAAKNDHPSALGIRIGQFTVFPQFGYTGNSFSFLAKNLEKLYPKSWNSGKEKREAGFQAELNALFSSKNYTPGYKNIHIRKTDGTQSTDIDAVLYEHSENCIYLFQLKWLGSYTTPNERNSRILNLQDANDWIEKATEWKARTAKIEILRLFGLHKIKCNVEDLQVRLIVLSRIWTRFGGEVNQNRDAAWLSWSRLRYLCLKNRGKENPMHEAWSVAIKNDDRTFTPHGHEKPYEFENLRVVVVS